MPNPATGPMDPALAAVDLRHVRPCHPCRSKLAARLSYPTVALLTVVGLPATCSGDGEEEREGSGGEATREPPCHPVGYDAGFRTCLIL